jgi:hypothetical protein
VNFIKQNATGTAVPQVKFTPQPEQFMAIHKGTVITGIKKTVVLTVIYSDIQIQIFSAVS